MHHLIMHRTSALALVIALLTSLFIPAGRAIANPLSTALPDGFFEEQIVGGLQLPTSFAVAPDGRIFITEKNGRVRIVDDGELQAEPFIDLSTEVNDAADRGLMGVAVHPNWPAQPYVYLAYTYDPPEARGYPASGARVSRVLRLRASADNLNVHEPGSGNVILGTNSTFANIGNPEKGDEFPFSCLDENGMFVQDCIPAEGTAHTVDFLKFAKDGSLFVSLGDGIVNSKGNWRAQDVNSLAGKILRINPMTGAGYASNPFYDGDLSANRAKVYALGLRNPFRFTFDSAGMLYVGEVGNSTWEEINRGGPGANFGWPCYEGEERMTNWAICDPLFSGAAEVTHGLYVYPHSALPPRGAAIGGDFYTGRLYPARYRGAYFFTDFNGGVITAMIFNPAGGYALQEFATSAPGPVQITMGPDGNLWMLYIATGELVRLRYQGADTASAAAVVTPRARATGTPTVSAGTVVTETANVTASFAASATTDITSTSEITGSIDVTATAVATPTPTPSAKPGSAGADAPGGSGAITRELWTEIKGMTIVDLTASPNYPGAPNARDTLEELNVVLDLENAGQRIRGYLYPPITGDYRFWIASDDEGQLFLSSDATPANAALIAAVPEWSPDQVWDKYPEQASAPLRLVAGKRYYIEVLHKQGTLADNLAVAWQPPKGARAVISGAYLSPLK